MGTLGTVGPVGTLGTGNMLKFKLLCISYNLLTRHLSGPFTPRINHLLGVPFKLTIEISIIGFTSYYFEPNS